MIFDLHTYQDIVDYPNLKMYRQIIIYSQCNSSYITLDILFTSSKINSLQMIL